MFTKLDAGSWLLGKPLPALRVMVVSQIQNLKRLIPFASIFCIRLSHWVTHMRANKDKQRHSDGNKLVSQEKVAAWK